MVDIEKSNWVVMNVFVNRRGTQRISQRYAKEFSLRPLRIPLLPLRLG